MNHAKATTNPVSDTASLSYQGSYICPVCRHGQITGLTLMDAFACNFCRHIFTANLVTQSIQVVDSSQPMSWRWNGRNWQSVYRDSPSLSVIVWLISATLIVLPASIVWLSAHVFPPLPGSTLSWFSRAWIGCVFGVHFLMVSWLLAEHYQVPLYISTRIRVQQWLGRR
ncbi:hypothetical protein IFO70_04255 [Phormidium tenue FACHB-886]|nr:hypothetical protein [Phormidium tenue FACHB-886]